MTRNESRVGRVSSRVISNFGFLQRNETIVLLLVDIIFIVSQRKLEENQKRIEKKVFFVFFWFFPILRNTNNFIIPSISVLKIVSQNYNIIKIKSFHFYT